jgi:predicted ATPase
LYQYSGTGKTILVQQAFSEIATLDGFFVTGKCDPQHRGQPYTAFVSALTELTGYILARDDSPFLMMELQDAMSKTDRSVLIEHVPKLEEVLDGEDSEKEEEDIGSRENHFIVSCLRFIRVISRPSRPLVLFLDDLQWADVASLDLLESLVTDLKNPSVVVVGAYSDNEVARANHPLTERIRLIRSKRIVTGIEVKNLDAKAMNSLVSDLLRSSEEDIKSLADIITTKTCGNPVFAIQFLNALLNEELVQYNLVTLQWRWDKEKIMSKFVTSNVANPMADKLRKRPPDTQLMLKVAACLGCQFDTTTLIFAMNAFNFVDARTETEGNANIILRSLDALMTDGLLERKTDGKSYVFVHDHIQHAAFCLIPIEEQEQFQGRIGKALVDSSTPEQLDSFVLVAVDLYNCGIPSILGNDAELVQLAALNLRAGQQVSKTVMYLDKKWP